MNGLAVAAVIFSGISALSSLGVFALVYRAGRVVQTVEDHSRRIGTLERWREGFAFNFNLER